MKSVMKMNLLAILLMMSVSLFAQSNDSTEMARRTPEERAKMQTARLTKELTLTADQSPKVQAIVLDRIQKTDQLRAQKSGDRRQNFTQIKAINDDYNTKMKALLTADQYTKFQAMQQDNRGKMREHRN